MIHTQLPKKLLDDVCFIGIRLLIGTVSFFTMEFPMFQVCDETDNKGSDSNEIGQLFKIPNMIESNEKKKRIISP